MNIVEKSLNEIKPYEKNPRKNDIAVSGVVESIKNFGFKVPIVIDKDGVIVAGHTRYKAAKRMGLERVPCIIADDLSEEQVRAFRLADNRVGELAEWDFQLLTEELLDIKDIDMGIFGFELQVETNREIVEDEPPEVDEVNEPIAKKGQIWKLGRHRLMCGDSTSANDLFNLTGGKHVTLVLTDPPYNMAYSGGGGCRRQGIMNDKMSESDFEKFLVAVYSNIERALVDGGSFYAFYKELGAGVFITAIKKAGLTFKQELVWVKNHIVLGGAKYQSMFEPCVYGCKGKSIKHWYAGRKERSVIEMVDLMSEKELRQALREAAESEHVTDVIRFDKPSKSELHPTMKPIKLLAYFIKNSCKLGDNVLDLFGGSGSTLIACEQTERSCFMMELDPKYVDVIIKRWENFTGQKAELLPPKE